MSLNHLDNFDAYGGTIGYMLDGVYAGIAGCALVADPDPLATGNVLRTQSSLTTNALTVVLPVARATIGIGFRLWLPFLPRDTSETGGIEWRDAGNVSRLAMQVNPIGGIEIRDSLRGTLYAATAGPVVTANAWYHIEAKAVFGVNTCTVEVRVEGVTVLTSTFAVVGTFTCQIVAWGTSSFNLTFTYFKDIIVWDSAGSQNNNFMGSITVRTMIANSDDTVGGWVPAIAGPSYQMVNNEPPLDSSEYLQAAVPPITPVVLGMTDLPSDVTSVRALRTMVRARKIDGGDGNLQVSLISGASTGNGADRPITAAFTYWMDMFETDPATGAQWLPAAANAAKLKLARTV